MGVGAAKPWKEVSAAIYIADYLLNEQAEIVIYDRKLNPEQIYADLDNLNSRSEAENKRLVEVVSSAEEVCRGAHAIAVLTEWEEFKELDWKKIHHEMLKPTFLFHGRNLLKAEQLLGCGFQVRRIGHFYQNKKLNKG